MLSMKSWSGYLASCSLESLGLIFSLEIKNLNLLPYIDKFSKTRDSLEPLQIKF
jgi:hypothetical protein